MNLAGKKIVVIGGSSGIGRSVALLALEEGANVFIGASRQDSLNLAIEVSGGRLQGAVLDAGNEQSVASFMQEAGPFDHLVFTAGNWGWKPPTSVSDVAKEDFDELMSVRFYGALYAAKHATGLMREGGSITLTTGISSFYPRAGAPLPSTMGGAVDHLASALAVDMAPVRVNAICPGVIGTEVWGDNAAEQFKPLTDTLLLKRMGTPEETAEAYLFAMKCGYLTGQTIRVDGGRSMI
jgi:NAD(P)-dependent dehydrogenase (short-subunit alcohol dehydrogenase family)